MLLWVCQVPPEFVAERGNKMLPDLGGGGERRSALQQHGGHVLVSFAGGQVERRVARGGGGVGRGAALQQLLDDVDFPQSTGDVQRCLVVLQRGREREREKGR